MSLLGRGWVRLAVVTVLSTTRAAATGTEQPKVPPAGAAALRGIDLDGLSDSERAAFWRMVRKYPSACGKAESLESSLRSDERCRRSVFAGRYVVRLLKGGLLESEAEERYEARFGPQPHAEIDLKEAPLRGDARAPITLVEFSDFQCPHCKHIQPVLERLLEEYRGKLKLYFKNYPIVAVHPYASLAAAAALAAGKQGKFWQFHDRLFGGDQEHVAMPDLEKIAKDLKLDVKKWKADIELVKEQVARDRAEGERLHIDSTPTLFLDGRRYHGPIRDDELKDWIEEELNR